MIGPAPAGEAGLEQLGIDARVAELLYDSPSDAATDLLRMVRDPARPGATRYFAGVPCGTYRHPVVMLLDAIERLPSWSVQSFALGLAHRAGVRDVKRFEVAELVPVIAAGESVAA